MSLVIEGIGTARPSGGVDQTVLAAAAEPCSCGSDRERRLLPALYRRTTVESRHSVVADPAVPDDVATQGERMLAFYPPAADPADRGPGMTARMRRYPVEALALAERACHAALQDAGVDPSDITQLVTVSCTGFSAPGIDIGLIDRLGLPTTVGRTMVGFMGCHGAMNGMRVARSLVDAEPASIDGDASPGRRGRVLLCCVELCTLHFQYGWDPQKVVANALFVDGAGAVVGCRMPDDPALLNGHAHAPRVIAHGSKLLPDSRDDMTWVIRDHGFEMTLSPRVPGLIAEHLRGWIEPWLARHGLSIEAVNGWAIHPGGPRIISAVEQALGLPAEAGDASRRVLRESGNMSSPTVLFILQQLRQARAPRPWVAIAFGPGLTVEAALIA